MVNLGNYSIEKSDEGTLMIEEHEKTFQHHGREEKLMERKNLKMNKEEDEYVKIIDAIAKLEFWEHLLTKF